MRKPFVIFIIILLSLQASRVFAQNPSSVGAVKGSPHLALGCPGTGNPGITLIARRGYACLHSSKQKTPLWVSYYLTPQDLKKSVQRKNTFQADPDLLSGYRAELSDYKGSGFDRGHMAPCEDMSRDKSIMDESFYLSNMIPQNPNNNQQFWRMLEARVNAYVKSHGAVYIITGPIYAKPLPTGYKQLPSSIGLDNVEVPTWLFKIVVRKLPSGKFDAVAVEVPNGPVNIKAAGLKDALEIALTSIDEIEKDTGLNFLNSLSPQEQERIESAPAASLWLLN